MSSTLHLHAEVVADVLTHFLSNGNVPQFINSNKGQNKIYNMFRYFIDLFIYLIYSTFV